jgi:AraC family transcriptional regulator, ethanolamine operon transcriptional activator
VPYDGVEFHRYSEPGELKAAEPNLYCQAIPMGREPFEIAVTAVHMGGVALIMGRASPCLGFLRTGADCAVLQLPLGKDGGLVLDTVACQPGVLGAWAGGADLLWANSERSSFAALALPFGAMEALLELPAGSGLLRQGSRALLQARPASWERAGRIVRAAAWATAAAPDTFDAEQPRQALRDDLLKVAHDLVSPEPDAALPAPRADRARRRMVVRADEYLRAHLHRPIYTEELCEALAVSATGLAEAFRAVFGVSPHRFLKLRRLSMVRAALQAREGPPPLVKSVALSHGFWHLGQFARDYRETFGETPSETLARGRG